MAQIEATDKTEQRAEAARLTRTDQGRGSDQPHHTALGGGPGAGFRGQGADQRKELEDRLVWTRACPTVLAPSSTLKRLLTSFLRTAAVILGRVGLIAGLLAFSFSAIAANECGSPIDLPVRLVEGLPVVSLTIRHVRVAMILDSGAERSVITPATAGRLRLRQDKAYPRTLHSIGGAVVGRSVELPGLAAAGTTLPNFGALVGSTGLPPIDGMVPDGLLGADILSSFDVDLDLPRSRVRLYGLSCSPVAARGQPYAAVKANRSLHDRLFFPALLNGRRVAAIIDTGAQRSVLDVRAALSAGADLRTLDRGPAERVRGIAGSELAHLLRFHQLVIGGQRVFDPVFLVVPFYLDDADLILGIDFLKTHRVWLSYGLHRVFLGTAAEGRRGPLYRLGDRRR